jgi:membrane-bound lytic murein transglycosylase B
MQTTLPQMNAEARGWARLRMLVAAAIVITALAVGSDAHADTIYFANGRTMSVKACRVEGGVMTVTLRGGGQATFDAALVSRVMPNEVPEPDEETPVAPATTATVAAPTIVLDQPPSGPRPYASLIETAAEKHGVPIGLVHAVVQAESNYQPRARSSAGARGLMQVMPRTGAELGVRNLYDPASNLDAGVRYLKSLMGEFELDQALAAYNAGPDAVRRFGGIPPYRETQDYVRRVLANLPVRP